MKDPDRVDPTKQSGRPFMLTAVPIGLVLVLLVMVVIGIFVA